MEIHAAVDYRHGDSRSIADLMRGGDVEESKVPLLVAYLIRAREPGRCEDYAYEHMS
ncbi:hypothetical protein Afe04nite_47600 [Asanoa ferruginea]|nr:hypothetical protein Afe04nite_47600 [Asanoa ferruginea]